MGPLIRSPYAILFICISFLFAAGCTGTPRSPGSGPSITTAGTTLSAGSTAGLSGPGDCRTLEECAAYCSAHNDECDQYCRDHPDPCNRFRNEPVGTPQGQPPEGLGGFGAGTACDSAAIKGKLMADMEKVLVLPPSSINPPNWMTKVLPASNPYPGYYYDLSTAFGPAVDPKLTGWTGTGDPPKIAGLDSYTFGYWEEVPQGAGGRMGEETPETMDFSRYQLAVFFTNVTGKSQAAMIAALPPLTMTEAEAKAFFASKIRRSFIDLGGRTLSRSGNNRMYEVRWHDSDDTQDFWDVQIGTGYIAIGQGKVYSAESALQGDPGTMWQYTACRPCGNCDDWTTGQALNRDCSRDDDCLGGLSCSGGYCVKPGAGQAAQATTPKGSPGGKGPGAACSTAADCDAGLSCTNGACSVPMGRP